MGVGLYKQWYTAVLHPQRLIISNNFCPMYNDVFVRGESAVGVQSRDFFLTTLAPAYIRWAMWTIQEILLSSVSLGILHYTAMWGGQGDQHVRGQEREKKGFRECCRFLSDVLSLSFTHFWTSRYWDCTLMRIMEMHMRNESPATKHKIYLPLCLGLPPPLQICQVSDTCSAAASKSQLHWGSCSLVWWSVSRCQSCVSLQDMRYGNRRALSGRTESEGVTFSRQKLANRERGRASAHIRRLNERRTVVLRFKSLSPEIW